MELRHIRYFIRAAEELHFTRAAESLFISQPTLSTHIQQLEEELGIPLFDRVGRKVILTEAGTIFLGHAKRALREIEFAEESISNLKGLTSGTLHLAAIFTFSQEMLPLWIASFHVNYPNIRIVVKTGDSDHIEESILAGEIDLALTFVPPAAPSLQSETLFTEEVFLVVAEKHALAGRSDMQLSELAEIPLALVSKRWTARRRFDAFMAEHGVVPNILIEMDDLHGILRIASEGFAGALLPRLVVSTYPNLRLIPLAEDKIFLNYGVVWHEQRNLSPAAKAFLEHIRRERASN